MTKFAQARIRAFILKLLTERDIPVLSLWFAIVIGLRRGPGAAGFPNFGG